MTKDRYSFLGIPVDDYTMDEAVEEVVSLVGGDSREYILSLNVDVMVKVDRNRVLKEAFAKSYLSLMDGKPPLLLARAKGVPLREKVSGSDFVPAVLEAANERAMSVFILGGSAAASMAAKERINRDYKKLSRVGAYSPPMGFEQTEDGICEAVMRVRDEKPDILILCFGCPKQEYFVYGLLDVLDVPCVICAGAAVDFLAGTQKRAPEWVSQIGFEWLYRFAREPKRLFRRYFVDSWHLLSMLLKYRDNNSSHIASRSN